VQRISEDGEYQVPGRNDGDDENGDKSGGDRRNRKELRGCLHGFLAVLGARRRRRVADRSGHLAARSSVVRHRNIRVQGPLQHRARVRGQRDLREAKQEERGPGEQATVPSVHPSILAAAAVGHLMEIMRSAR